MRLEKERRKKKYVVEVKRNRHTRGHASDEGVYI